MRRFAVYFASLSLLLPLNSAYAAGDNLSRSVDWRQIISIIERLKDLNKNRQTPENVMCRGQDGTTLEFSTSGAGGRDLIGLVKIKVEGRSVTFSSAEIRNYYNGDDRIAMDVFKKPAQVPYFSFRADLAPTVKPQIDEVATHTGTVSITSVGFSDLPHKVSCSTIRKGAGNLKPQAGPERVF